MNENEFRMTLETPKMLREGLIERFREAYRSKGWSRSELARRSRVPASTIGKFEKEGTISFRQLVDLAFALGAQDPLMELFRMEEKMTLEELKRSKGLK